MRSWRDHDRRSNWVLNIGSLRGLPTLPTGDWQEAQVALDLLVPNASSRHVHAFKFSELIGMRRIVPETFDRLNSCLTWAESMSSNTSHFLFVLPRPAWGKNYHRYITLLISLKVNFLLDISNRTHQAFLCSCDTPRVWTGKHYSDFHSYPRRTRQDP